MYPEMLERFIRYARVNTRSDVASDAVPSTPNQKEFLLTLEQELKDLGFSSVQYDERDAYVTGCLPSNLPDDVVVPAVGFIAHVDTADYNAENIQPQVHSNYDGEDIVLNESLGMTMRVSEFPNLKHYIGQTLITTDGTTLLGADDKAGMTSILEAVLYLMRHPEEQHGEIWLAFGPDEEIGKGAHRFEVDKFPVDFAYTLDSGVVGKLEYETFNAATITLTFQGTSVHPGQAKNVMVNATTEAMRFHRQLPEGEVPELTEGYEGFYLLEDFQGSIDHARMTYIIRDHDEAKFEARKQFLVSLIEQMNADYDYPRIQYDMYDQYYNMDKVIQASPQALDVAIEAYRALGIEPDIQPFRGGTDGCIISYKGIPTPNLFTGAENLHGCYEFIALESMERASDLVREIITIISNK